ncbi:hypothetical protein LNP17_29445 [Klebsiella variicola subsp. variicola]|nr:hypothetical protein [Klebsiella variicola subsp. variicola]
MTKTTIDIQAFINEHPFTRYQWMILALCFITVAMDGFAHRDHRIYRLRPGTGMGRGKIGARPGDERRAGGPGGRRLNRGAAG